MNELDLPHIQQRIESLSKQRPTNTWWYREMRGRPRVIACEVERETEHQLVLAMIGAGRVRKNGPERYFPSFEEAYHDMVERRTRALVVATTAAERGRLEEELASLRHEYGPNGSCRLL